MLSKLGQMLNPAGIASAAHVVLREPQIALPHVEVSDICSIDWNALRLSGFKGVVLDKDNTITAPYVQSIWPSLASSLNDCKKAFEGRVALLSNSAGLYQYDADGTEAAALEQALNISVIRHGSKKPSGSSRELEKHFGCDASLLVMVGDRYFTDIVYGNKNGLLTFITKPLTLEGEPFVVKKVRGLEQFLVRRWREKGVVPVKHKLMSSSNQFVKDPVNIEASSKVHQRMCAERATMLEMLQDRLSNRVEECEGDVRDAQQPDSELGDQVTDQEVLLDLEHLPHVELGGDKGDDEAAGSKQLGKLHQGGDVALQREWKHEHMSLEAGDS
ncbi:hypothetical protein L7F22_009049 [Adiantum nelumboides]|nr:hypothetical protein [Adiantum nelumboides]